MKEIIPPFQKIPKACKTTGLSMFYLRKGCKDGSIPHIVSGGSGGGTYYINVPALLKQLGVYDQEGDTTANG